MFEVVEQVLAKVVRARRALTISEAKMRRLVRTESKAQTNVLEVLYSRGFIFSIVEIVGKLMDSVVD